jgi:hypothetical protein
MDYEAYGQCVRPNDLRCDETWLGVNIVLERAKSGTTTEGYTCVYVYLYHFLLFWGKTKAEKMKRALSCEQNNTGSGAEFAQAGIDVRHRKHNQ